MLAFPFETITSAAIRNSMIERVIDYFSLLIPPEPVADFDADGLVDGADFLAWQRGFGSVNPAPADGDANFDGVVDAADLAEWQTQFGTAAPPASISDADVVIAELLAAEESASPAPSIAPSDLNAIAGHSMNQRSGLEDRRGKRHAGRIRPVALEPTRTGRQSTWEPSSTAISVDDSPSLLEIAIRAETLPSAASEAAFAELGSLLKSLR
jgi:hypothetical protein